MTKWKYLVYYVSSLIPSSAIQHEFNVLGSDGWELASTDSSFDNYTLYTFKRKITD